MRHKGRCVGAFYAGLSVSCAILVLHDCPRTAAIFCITLEADSSLTGTRLTTGEDGIDPRRSGNCGVLGSGSTLPLAEPP